MTEQLPAWFAIPALIVCWGTWITLLVLDALERQEAARRELEHERAVSEYYRRQSTNERNPS